MLPFMVAAASIASILKRVKALNLDAPDAPEPARNIVPLQLFCKKDAIGWMRLSCPL